MKKVVLAYSGGLDTSCIIPWLKDRGYEIIAVVGNVGQGDNFDEVKSKALKSGACKVYCLDLQKELIEDYALPALKAGALYEGKYNLACALSRPLIAYHQVLVARKEKADGLVHGCTGKGNDQVRFEVTYRLMEPTMEVLAPVRVWEFKSRDEEIDYARSKGVPVSASKKKPYSIDTNVYGRAMESGVLEDPMAEPPEDIFYMTTAPEKAPAKPGYVEIGFNKGVPVSVDGTKMKPLELVIKLNEIAGKHGVGRVDMIENRLVGIKSRELYENPAGAVLHLGIREIESMVMDRDSLRFKEILSQKYAELTYNGLWLTPLKFQMDAFFDKYHENTTGVVRIKLFKGHAMVVGRKSPYSRYSEKMATYGKGDKFDQSLADGFIKLWTVPFQRHS
ncbi:MAG: argininosuccinate synthase [Candidatus Omnitrophica bacterium]|nr:argininosuccinate synthase [Candidatus Omnitrophota bacterium]